MLLPRGCGAAVLHTGHTPGREKLPSLETSFIFFLVAEHPLIYKTLKVVVLNLLAYEPCWFVFFFSQWGHRHL